MRWVEHAAHGGESGGVYRVLVGRDPSGDGRIMLRSILRKWDGGHGLD
jgi:hypothetical protein